MSDNRVSDSRPKLDTGKCNQVFRSRKPCKDSPQLAVRRLPPTILIVNSSRRATILGILTSSPQPAYSIQPLLLVRPRIHDPWAAHRPQPSFSPTFLRAVLPTVLAQASCTLDWRHAPRLNLAPSLPTANWSMVFLC